MDVYEILSRKSNLIYKNPHSLDNDNNNIIIDDGCESKLWWLNENGGLVSFCFKFLWNLG